MVCFLILLGQTVADKHGKCNPNISSLTSIELVSYPQFYANQEVLDSEGDNVTKGDDFNSIVLGYPSKIHIFHWRKKDISTALGNLFMED